MNHLQARDAMSTVHQDTKAMNAIGLHTAANIMEKWGANQEQIASTLRISASTIARAKANKQAAFKLDADQLDRISYVLNIHAALRTLFENQENVYGFVAMPNQNTFFNGRTPLEIMAQGSFANLYETYRHIDGLRGAL